MTFSNDEAKFMSSLKMKAIEGMTSVQDKSFMMAPSKDSVSSQSQADQLSTAISVSEQTKNLYARKLAQRTRYANTNQDSLLQSPDFNKTTSGVKYQAYGGRNSPDLNLPKIRGHHNDLQQSAHHLQLTTRRTAPRKSMQLLPDPFQSARKRIMNLVQNSGLLSPR